MLGVMGKMAEKRTYLHFGSFRWTRKTLRGIGGASIYVKRGCSFNWFAMCIIVFEDMSVHWWSLRKLVWVLHSVNVRDDTRQNSVVFTSVIVPVCNYKTPQNVVCSQRPLFKQCHHDANIWTIPCWKRDVYVVIKNQVIATLRAMCQRKR